MFTLYHLESLYIRQINNIKTTIALKTTASLISSVIIIFLMVACSSQSRKQEKSKYISDTKLTAALGKWQRTDGEYIIELSNIKTDSTVEAAYSNPKPINISETMWKVNDGYFYFYIKLDDEGYPGSYYSLGYFAEDDKMYGIYYQALQGQQYDVVFERQ